MQIIETLSGSDRLSRSIDFSREVRRAEPDKVTSQQRRKMRNTLDQRSIVEHHLRERDRLHAKPSLLLLTRQN